MDPTVVAAWIAAGVSVLTLLGTLAAQYFGRRATKEDTEKAFAEQRGQLNETLKAQSEQLDRTLDAQNQQLDRTLDEQRTRTFNERFATAAEQLGSEKAAVRLAGVYAMAGLADDWAENRQTCVDVLCAYLRMPYEPDPGEDSPLPELLAFQASREARHTVIRVISAHLQVNAAPSWEGLDFDFTGVVFDGGNFSGARFSEGEADFSDARFTGGIFYFNGARFSGGKVDFTSAEFSGGAVDFSDTIFSGATVDFSNALFSGSKVHFNVAQFSGGAVSFSHAQFSGGTLTFAESQFSGGTADFNFAFFLDDANVSFGAAQFSGGSVSFAGAQFSGGTVNFEEAKFSGGTLDFSEARDWSTPPKFPWTGDPPVGIKLPDSSGA